MGGFKNCNREVITHSELTLQMDELLECTLPRLRVRKLHMHKQKWGRGNIILNEVRETARHYPSLCPLVSHQSQFNAMGSQSSDTQDWDWARKEISHKSTLRDILTAIVTVYSVFYAKMSKGNTIKSQIWESWVVRTFINKQNSSLTTVEMQKANWMLGIYVEVELLWIQE